MKKLTLSELVERLEADYYSSLAAQCAQVEMQLSKLVESGVQQITSQYNALCSKIAKEVGTFVRNRREQYIPYIQKLEEKAGDNHDCSNCTGSCKLNHDIQLFELKATHADLKAMLSQLQIASLPLHSDSMYPDAYRVLRSHIALMENDLLEILFYEENFLIPKIAETQKIINAGNH